MCAIEQKKISVSAVSNKTRLLLCASFFAAMLMSCTDYPKSIQATSRYSVTVDEHGLNVLLRSLEAFADREKLQIHDKTATKSAVSGRPQVSVFYESDAKNSLPIVHLESNVSESEPMKNMILSAYHYGPGRDAFQRRFESLLEMLERTPATGISMKRQQISDRSAYDIAMDSEASDLTMDSEASALLFEKGIFSEGFPGAVSESTSNMRAKDLSETTTPSNQQHRSTPGEIR